LEISKILKLCLKKRFQEAFFENIIPIFSEFKVSEKFAKSENKAFCLITIDPRRPLKWLVTAERTIGMVLGTAWR